MGTEGGHGRGADDREALVDHLRHHLQGSLSELRDAVEQRRPGADPDAVLRTVEAMEEEGALIRRDHLYALAPWLRDGAAPPDEGRAPAG